MSDLRFAHLHLHDTFSLLDGFGTPDAVAKHASKNGILAIAQTNHGTISGHIAHKRACDSNGVYPVYGCEFYVTDDMTHQGLTDEQEKGVRALASNKVELDKMRKELLVNARSRSHLLVLALDNEGYSNLRILVSKSNLEGFYHKPRIDFDTLIAHGAGLFISTACISGDIPRMILADDMEGARALTVRLRDAFSNRFALEIMPLDMDEQRKVNLGLVQLSNELGVPIIATNDAHYITQRDAWAQDVLLAVGTNGRMNDEKRFRFGNGELFMRTGEQMLSAFRMHHPDLDEATVATAIENSYNYAFMCKADPLETTARLPQYVTQDASGHNQYLTTLCRMGWVKRGLNRHEAHWKEAYSERVKYELDLLKSKGFANYFLITWDAVRWAKDHGIFVGPARGSSAGSLVAYLLEITEVDPLRFGLSFERFISPHRMDYPDIDIDFEDGRRAEVREYLAEKYGPECVASVATMNSLKFKSAFRDSCRVFGVQHAEVGKIADIIPDDAHFTSEYDTEFPPDMAAFRIKHGDVVRAAVALQGQMRSGGKHAAGIVITDRPLMQVTALERRRDDIVVALDKDEAETLGLVKFDLLGLKTMSVWAETFRTINASRETPLIVSDLMGLDDAKVFAEFAAGNTAAVFQFNKPGGRRICQQIRVRCFNDLTLVNALDRPGPLQSGGTDEFIARRNGAKIEYVHEVYRTVSTDTLGVLLYQEQVMAICREMAGLDWADVHAVRKAISKSKGAEALEKFWVKFRDGAAATCQCPEPVARRVWDAIVKYGGYAFNKSHAVAYAIISYISMWLKVNYPAEFLCATMRDGAEGMLRESVTEARRYGVKVSEPDVNQSRAGFRLVDGVIYAGLDAVKGVGGIAAREIINAREESPFKNVLDFVSRVKRAKVNKGVVKKLIDVGAFKSLHANTPVLKEYWESLAGKKKGLFDEIEPKNLNKKVKDTIHDVVKRMSLLPFMPEVHPAKFFKNVVKRLDKLYPKPTTIAELRQAGGENTRNEVRTILGTMVKMEVRQDRGKVGLCQIEDETGDIVIRLDYRHFDTEVDVFQGESGKPLIAIVSPISEYRADVREIADLEQFDRALTDMPMWMSESMSNMVDMPGRVCIPFRDGHKPLRKAVKLKNPFVVGLATRVWSGPSKIGEMGFMDLADESGQQIVLIWPDSWVMVRDYLHEGHIYEAKLGTTKDKTLCCDRGRGHGFKDITPIDEEIPNVHEQESAQNA